MNLRLMLLQNMLTPFIMLMVTNVLFYYLCIFVFEYITNNFSDFEKLGGFHIFLPCIRSEHPSVRIKTTELISTLVQNNPYCQEKFMENPNYLKALMSMVENDLNDEVRVKALAAISSESQIFCNQLIYS